MSVDIEKRNFFVAHKLGDGWRVCYPAPAFSEPHLIALKLILLFLSSFFITFGYRHSGCHLSIV